MCHSENFPGPRGAGLICIHININLHRNWIGDESAQLLLLCIYNKLHCKCWQHFTKQRGRQNILWESKSKWSTIFLTMVLHGFPKIWYGHRHWGMQLWGSQMATTLAWMAKCIWFSTDRNLLWSVRDWFFSGTEIRIMEFLYPPPTLYFNTFFFTGLHEFHLPLHCERKGFTYLMFLSACYLYTGTGICESEVCSEHVLEEGLQLQIKGEMRKIFFLPIWKTQCCTVGVQVWLFNSKRKDFLWKDF